MLIANLMLVAVAFFVMSGMFYSCQKGRFNEEIDDFAYMVMSGVILIVWFGNALLLGYLSMDVYLTYRV